MLQKAISKLMKFVKLKRKPTKRFKLNELLDKDFIILNITDEPRWSKLCGKQILYIVTLELDGQRGTYATTAKRIVNKVTQLKKMGIYLSSGKSSKKVTI